MKVAKIDTFSQKLMSIISRGQNAKACNLRS